MEVAGDCTEMHIRFKDPPPADMEPDPDYVPGVGEWFWYGDPPNRHGEYDHQWQLRQQRADGVYWNGAKIRTYLPSDPDWVRLYGGICLPATASE